MRVTVQRQLTSYALRKRSVQIRVLLRQLADDISTLLALLDHLELSVVLSQEVVQLGDQAFHSRNELDQALRDQYRTEVITLGGTFSHDTSHVSNDIVQRHILLLNLLGDDTNVRLSLQSALQSDMRSGAIETADVVIQTDQPSRVATAIHAGRQTRRIVWQNISLAFGVKLLVLILGAGGIATLWEAVFADVGVALIAIVNAIRIQKLIK